VNRSGWDTGHIWTRRRRRSCWHGGHASRFVLRPTFCASFSVFAIHFLLRERVCVECVRVGWFIPWQMQNGTATPGSPHPVLPCSEPPHRHLCTSSSPFIYIFSAYATSPFYLMSVPSLLTSCIYQQTDDILPFRNSILGEYALLMAPKPIGLGLTESEIETVARMGMESRFPNIIP
jgi:hypothetical protein